MTSGRQEQLVHLLLIKYGHFSGGFLRWHGKAGWIAEHDSQLCSLRESTVQKGVDFPDSINANTLIRELVDCLKLASVTNLEGILIAAASGETM
jgi:hypothetical protein